MALSSTPLTFKEAQRLIGEQYSCFEIGKCRKHLKLSPAYIGRVAEGIHEALRGELNKYSEQLQGIPIAYDKPKSEQSFGYMMDENPYLHFGVQMEYVVFKPKVGSILQGYVNKLSEDNIGCLVHGTFNASIHKPQNTPSTEWVGKQLNGGDEVIFEVTQMQTKSGVVSFYGKMPADVVGAILDRRTCKRKEVCLTEESMDGVCSDSGSSKKRKKHEDDSTSMSQESSCADYLSEEGKKVKKKKKQKVGD